MRFKLLYSYSWHEPQCQNQKRDQSITFYTLTSLYSFKTFLCSCSCFLVLKYYIWVCLCMIFYIIFWWASVLGTISIIWLTYFVYYGVSSVGCSVSFLISLVGLWLFYSLLCIWVGIGLFSFCRDDSLCQELCC